MDGFTNLQEYKNDTDPLDPNSHPTVIVGDDDDDEPGSKLGLIIGIISIVLIILVIAGVLVFLIIKCLDFEKN